MQVGCGERESEKDERREKKVCREERGTADWRGGGGLGSRRATGRMQGCRAVGDRAVWRWGRGAASGGGDAEVRDDWTRRGRALCVSGSRD